MPCPLDYQSRPDMRRAIRVPRPLRGPAVCIISFGIVALTACTDRLTAPQAEQLVLATEALSAGEATSAVDRLWEALELPMQRPGALSRVVVHDGPRRREFVALVHERVMIPEGGLGGDPCAGPRRTLLLHGPGAIVERGQFHGGDFSLPVQAGTHPLCAWNSLPFHAPRLVVRRGSHDDWVGTQGTGSISPGTPLGPCALLSSDAGRAMREIYGMTCEYTRHDVELRALLKPSLHRNGQSYLGSSSRRLAIPAAEVRGVRVTIDCAATRRAAELCGAASS